MAYYSNESKVFAQPWVFLDSHIPDNIVAREKEIKLLTSCIAPSLKRMKPLHCWLYGPTGSGKTCMAKYILSQFEERAKLEWLYVNCWDVYSFPSVLEKIVRDLRILRAEIRNTSHRLDRLDKILSGKPFVFVLDEVDRLPTKERNDLLYNLCDLGKVGLVCIAYKRRSLNDLDERVKSRLNPVLIEFNPYGQKTLVSILRQKAEIGLLPETWQEESLRWIAQLAKGDARIAIQTLRNAAHYAEKESKDLISEEHLKLGWTGVKDLKKLYTLNSLTPHHRLVYRLIEKNPGIVSGDLWHEYLHTCKRKRIEPVAIRTFREYVNKLVRLRLITVQRFRPWGSSRVFHAVNSL